MIRWSAASLDPAVTSDVLLFILGGGLIGAVISGYRFAVNFRTTERSLARNRLNQAARNERMAQHEAGLWQARCADLEYQLRRQGIEPPALSEELRRMVSQSSTEGDGREGEERMT